MRTATNTKGDVTTANIQYNTRILYPRPINSTCSQLMNNGAKELFAQICSRRAFGSQWSKLPTQCAFLADCLHSELLRTDIVVRYKI